MQTPQSRTEKDFLGPRDIPADSLTGIHTARAVENFGLAGGAVNTGLIKAYGFVKLACLRANIALGYITREKGRFIEQACDELIAEKLEVQCPLSALQGGAGTSTNMYVNELLANRALVLMGEAPGRYDIINPFADINLHQSTNDTYPTALRVAALLSLRHLEQSVSLLTDAFQVKEKEFADVVKLARTQLQDAVLTTMGRQMGAYAEAFSKDRWRIYKCHERLRTINLGGTAIGTGLGAPQKYIFKVADELRSITGLNLARAENMVQATQNCDEFVEVSGILKACAVNMLKISSDLRLMACGPAGGLGELELPARQVGSSIMPGKINPVIAEFAGMAAMQAISHDLAITLAAANGQLELNAFMPLIAHSLLSMLDILIAAAEKFRVLLVAELVVNRVNCQRHVDSSTAVITSFISKIGYEKAAEIAKKAVESGKTIKEILIAEGVCTEGEYREAISPEMVMALGFRV